jgi:hypothetical protein
MIPIRLEYPYLNWPIFRQTPKESGQWENYAFNLNQNVENCEAWIVYSYLDKPFVTQDVCGPLIFVTTEPVSIHQYPSEFLKQFDFVVTCQKEINHPGKIYDLQGLPWFVGKSYDELSNMKDIPKKKKIIVSHL